IARRQGFSFDAVQSMLTSVINGNGSMAQFSHYEFGGSGQWMQGGMTMVGDMFNNYLKGRVDNLCSELSRLSYNQPGLFVEQPAQANWWGPDLKFPNTSGGQNGMRYAWFAQARRLAIESNGQVIVYDTLDHQIGGVSQQQSGGYSVTFSSQYGYVDLSRLPVITINGLPPLAPAPAPAPLYAPAPSYSNSYSNTEQNSYVPVNSPVSAGGDIFAHIEKLAALQSRGILSEQEYASKKAELLSRL
ncbi:MAG: SHOCT domain-containing protein, partial [Rhodoferax sp.]|nr:SHOCT domain-containing protein [Rhodoferax sp.]